jgi:hypothetical protein
MQIVIIILCFVAIKKDYWYGMDYGWNLQDYEQNFNQTIVKKQLYPNIMVTGILEFMDIRYQSTMKQIGNF